MKHTNEIHYNDKKSQPRLCPTCNYVWSREYDSTTKTIASILLPDFPKYKLRKHICYFCKPINNTWFNELLLFILVLLYISNKSVLYTLNINK